MSELPNIAGKVVTNGYTNNQKTSFIQRLKTLIIGGGRNLDDPKLFHKLSLIAFFAWVGLGADGLTSSCYGPEEAFLALKGHTYLAILVAFGTVFTVFVIAGSYSQIIELFPTGGGGYLVASKLLSPNLGMLSGCALLIDYVLTITVSVASGADALFSFLPAHWNSYKLEFAIITVMLLMILNLRGVKESVVPLVPIFLTFIVTHLFAIVYTFFSHIILFPEIVSNMTADVRSASSEIGIMGMLFLVLRAYSMGAGTYTGIEAVSNGLPILREPKVQTGKRTMNYMAFSLAFTVMGLLLAYLIYQVKPQSGKTLNAVLFESITQSWSGNSGYVFVLITLFSEAVLLVVAAQTGFLGGPRVLANMAQDRWFPTKFAMLSDRLVTQNGIVLMGIAALITMIFTQGSVRFLVVLYSINVFITFLLSQTGMVRHWWNVRKSFKKWRKKILINGVGLFLTAFILISVTVIKFNEGGWITLLVTGALVSVSMLIKRHYNNTLLLLRRLDDLVAVAESSSSDFLQTTKEKPKIGEACDPKAKTAVLLVNGFNGLGLHTLFNVIRLFGGTFKNFVFVQIGVFDAGNFKGSSEIENLQRHINNEVQSYVDFMLKHGYCAEGYSSIGIDVVDEITTIAPKILERFPHAIFFGGQLVFPEEGFFTRWLHNYTVFAIQRRFYHQGIPIVMLPIRV
ncbi:APC family permease [Patescibacteria group bacterium]|nr:APC family permease [Patescibacteria group bacterium]